MPEFICYNWMPTISDHVIDLPESFYNKAGTSRLHKINDFNPYKVKDGDLIFVKTDFIVNGHFQNNVLNKIYKRFNLITGVSSFHLGRDGGDNYKIILEHPNLNKWFCTNPPVEKSNKIVPLPIGFQEPDRPGGDQEFLLKINQNKTPFENKKDKIFLPYHTPSTNPIRKELFNYLKSLPFVESQEEKQNLVDYYKTMDQYKFVIGLEGSGPDIHRNYETMLVGSIPVNKLNIIKSVFEEHKIDTVFLNDWKNLNEKKFDMMLKSKYNTEKYNYFLELKNHIDKVKGLLNVWSN
jgi:hypothetical protein